MPSRQVVSCFKKAIAVFMTFAAVSAAVADPITRHEAESWVRRVRQINNWPVDFDVRKEAHQRREAALNMLKTSPRSSEAKRDLADALHTLGHFAEHDHQFDEAAKYHLEAFTLYLQSGLKTRESYNGPVHALEHVYMDYYDNGVALERAGKEKESLEYFKKAQEFALENQLADLDMSDRFNERDLNLNIKLREALSPVDKTASIILERLSDNISLYNGNTIEFIREWEDVLMKDVYKRKNLEEGAQLIAQQENLVVKRSGEVEAIIRKNLPLIEQVLKKDNRTNVKKVIRAAAAAEKLAFLVGEDLFLLDQAAKEAELKAEIYQKVSQAIGSVTIPRNHPLAAALYESVKRTASIAAQILSEKTSLKLQAQTLRESLNVLEKHLKAIEPFAFQRGELMSGGSRSRPALQCMSLFGN